MENKNIFDGKHKLAKMSHKVYTKLMSEEWVKYIDVYAEFNNIPKDQLKHQKMSSLKHYSTLKKAFCNVCHAINDRAGKECIETEGNKRNKRFRYVGDNKHPLEDLMNAKIAKDVKLYWEFCQDSLGFFPQSWLDFFFNGYQDLISMKATKKKGRQVIKTSMERETKNIDLLPMLYMAIKNKTKPEIAYKKGYEEAVTTHIVHPHYIKEFNGRWHLYGYDETKPDAETQAFAFDRIEGEPKVLNGKGFVSARDGYYDEKFKHIVGLSDNGNEIKEIYVRAHTLYIYQLNKTKPIHDSQTVVKEFGKHADGEYGEFMLKVKVNNEFIGRILQMGEGLEISGPTEIRSIIKEKIKKMNALYEAKSEKPEQQE